MTTTGNRPGALVRVMVFAVQLYRNTISPFRPASCRFMPTCSEYAVDALQEYGMFRGSWLAIVRLAKCGPWHRGGWDPIPDRPATLQETRGIDSDPDMRSDSLV